MTAADFAQAQEQLGAASAGRASRAVLLDFAPPDHQERAAYLRPKASKAKAKAAKPPGPRPRAAGPELSRPNGPQVCHLS